MPRLMSPEKDRLIHGSILCRPELVVLALPGTGCSPRIYDGVHCAMSPLNPLDWAKGKGPFDPMSVAHRLITELRERAGPTMLAGHSAGAFISLLIAIEAPDCVQGLVLSNSGAYIDGHSNTSLQDRIRDNWNASEQSAFLQSCFLSPPAPALWTHLLDYLAGLSTSTLLEAVIGQRQHNILGRLSRVQCPTLVAHGRHDMRRSVDEARQLAAGIPQAELLLLPGGHTPMVDCPAEYQSALISFLSRHAEKLSLK